VASAAERFEELFTAFYSDLMAYAIRRCWSRQDAEDVVAETFAVAWRRLDELPEGDQSRLWLFGTARLVLTNPERYPAERILAHTRWFLEQLHPATA
jgi:RNA polymerase sigma-70 factor, ECF subfamily